MCAGIVSSGMQLCQVCNSVKIFILHGAARRHFHYALGHLWGGALTSVPDENTRSHWAKNVIRSVESQDLARAPLGCFYNAPHWGGGYFEPPLISETTGPILKIQAAFESPGKTVEGKQILLTSGSRVTSQVRSNSKCSTFRAWWHRRAKLQC